MTDSGCLGRPGDRQAGLYNHSRLHITCGTFRRVPGADGWMRSCGHSREHECIHECMHKYIYMCKGSGRQIYTKEEKVLWSILSVSLLTTL